MPTVWVAVDEADERAVERVLLAIHPHRHIKVGLEVFCRLGPGYVRRLCEDGYDVFLDLKCHDIPRTVGRAVAAVRDLGAKMLTVHAAGGRAMLEAAQAEAGPMALVAVTVLTSLDEHLLREMGMGRSPREWALRLAELAQGAGLSGVVASGDEVAAIRATWPHARAVVPGIRLVGQAVHDQRRVVTPEVAVNRGATDLVVGRAITRADNPREALDLVCRAALRPEKEET
ncbi:MAG: orotidine-5'-phosphate decarboxylase [Firmicutes bacterium]|nr:orotidine-5'-phosphate decarboxylase [Bacillota bacterium]